MVALEATMMMSLTALAQTNDSISTDTTLWFNQTHQLGEVVVKSRLPKTKLKGNSMVTRIKGSVLAQSGTAQEMLAKVPGMTAKGEELEVLGKGTPIFYINGRKMRDKEELKRLRSEEIASVEVITNPGAQYDATISSVVRIKTIPKEGDGFGFDLNTGLNQDLRFGESDPSAQLNLRYRHNNLDLFGMVNYWKWDQTTLFSDEQSNYLPTDKGVLNINQFSHSRNHFKNNGIDYNLGFNWQIAENHSTDNFCIVSDLDLCKILMTLVFHPMTLIDNIIVIVCHALCPPICLLRSLAVAPSSKFSPLRMAFLPKRCLIFNCASCIRRSLSSLACSSRRCFSKAS